MRKVFFSILAVGLAVSAITLADGTFYCSWPLTSMPESLPLASINRQLPIGWMMLSHLKATNIKRDVELDGVTGASMLCFHHANEQCEPIEWPTGETSWNPQRYVDFSVNAPDTLDLHVAGIGLLIGAHSTPDMKCAVRAGVGADWTNAQLPADASQTALPNKAMDTIEWYPQLTIPAGDTLHLRLFPWVENVGGSGKYLLLRDVWIQGTTTTPSTEKWNAASSSSTYARKCIRNGQILIFNNKKVYTVSGTELR